MMPLPRELCRSVPYPANVSFTARPLQSGLGGYPWMVAVASILLNRARWLQAAPVLANLIGEWPTPEMLALADAAHLERIVRPCGLHHNRARVLIRMSGLWNSSAWADIRDLPGVGVYVADAVGLFCFGCTELESNDHVLRDWAVKNAISTNPSHTG